jgi:TRAP-type C4-dicarboxylate transport system permease small subunit
MKIQKTSYLDIRFNWVYSIAVIFSVVTILRYLWIFWRSARDSDALDSTIEELPRKDIL